MSAVLTQIQDLCYADEGARTKLSSVCEIEEEESSSELFEIKNVDGPMVSIKEELEDTNSLFSLNFLNDRDNDNPDNHDFVYVAVGRTDSSMDALIWTLNHALTNPSTIVFLIHVFPELRYIPTPLGKMPISQVNPEQKEDHMILERSKRREFLQKFLDVCSASEVKVDTILIESDTEAKALLDLIPILNVRKLVLGTTKSSVRKVRSRRGNGIAGQVLQNAPESCDVMIICEGKEVVVDSMSEPPSPQSNVASPKAVNTEENQRNDSFGCSCFKPKVIA